MFSRTIVSRMPSVRPVIISLGRRMESASAAPASASSTAVAKAAEPAAAASKAVVASKHVATAPTADHGSSFADRLASFLVGTGVGFGIGYFLLHDELVESNTRMENAIAALNARMKKLEKSS